MRWSVVVAVFLILSSGPALADDVSNQMDEAKRLYENGRLADSVRELETAISGIRRRLSARLGSKMPPAPAGWTAGEVKTRDLAIAGKGRMITREYLQSNGGGKIQAHLIVDSPMIQRLAVLLDNPMFKQSRPGMKRLKIKGAEGLSRWKEKRRRGEINVILAGGQLMLQARGWNVDGPEVLTRFMETWDFEQAKKIAGL